MKIYPAKSLDRTEILRALKERPDTSRHIGDAIQLTGVREDIFFHVDNVLKQLFRVGELDPNRLRKIYSTTFRPRDAVNAVLQLHYRHLLASTGFLDLEETTTDPAADMFREMEKSIGALSRTKREAEILEGLRLEPPISSKVATERLERHEEIVHVLGRTRRIIMGETSTHILH
jgi:hypothetical protein